MKKRNKLFAVLLALSTLTASVSAVNIADSNVWNGGGTLEVVNIFNGTPHVMTTDILKQLRYRKKSDGDLIWYIPVEKDVLHLGYMYPREPLKSPFGRPDLVWKFDDYNQIFTVTREKLGTRTTTYSELENIDSWVDDDIYYGRVSGKMLPKSAMYWNYQDWERVQFSYDKYGRIKGVKQSTGTTQYVYEVENFEIRPTIAGKSLSGKWFDFKVVTTHNVKTISIVGDMPEEPYGWEISHDYLAANYGLDCVDNGDGMTKTWTFTMPIYNPGAPRTFWIKTDGRDYGISEQVNVRRTGMVEAISLGVSPQIGNRSAVGVADSGTNFKFKAVTYSYVDKIDIAADLEYNIGEKYYWTIPYDYLVSNCELTSWENGDGTKTWEFNLPIYETGWPRKFWVLADGVDNGVGVPVYVY